MLKKVLIIRVLCQWLGENIKNKVEALLLGASTLFASVLPMRSTPFIVLFS